ncbi:hypothetical protein KAU11_08955 [Candidatus Babeliales bacterium]|nr:hypothetical protein [Candidatus Babeliales bacterium]
MVLSSLKKAAGLFCCAYGCKEEPADRKGGLCHKHYKRKRRKNDPIGVRYNDLAQSVKKRGKLVYFSLSEFREWCKRTGYLKKGYRGFSATLDRRCNAHDYHLWNLQIKTNRANARKGSGFSGAIFTKAHHFGIAPDDWEAADGDLPF